MKFLFVLIVLSSTVSCVDNEFGSRTETTFINISGHRIQLQDSIDGKIKLLDSIGNNEKRVYKLGGNLGGTNKPLFPFDVGDSTLVVYYEKASIWHTTDTISVVSRSLMLESSYEGGKTGDKTYEFTYTFTPADYEEALEFGD